ncbi:helix-turn-helix domain-containing protein [Candidatus Bipolaricaulota bacterium]|nr:helix-turn-helix domain-containing protein [Candidatus Bipolaricaulota bacterium]
MPKAQFSDILHKARSDKGLSLRQLATQSGIEFTRLSRMEHGTRPAPGLPEMRRLAELLSLNLVDLLVSAGTPREAVEQLLWVERMQQAKRVKYLAEYRPEGHRAGIKNEFVATVVERDGAFCKAMIGSETWCLLTFSDAAVLRVIVPPEAILMFSASPESIAWMPSNIFRTRVCKIRNVGRLLNLVLEVGGIELNALALSTPNHDVPTKLGDEMFVSISPVALLTEPLERMEGRT